MNSPKLIINLLGPVEILYNNEPLHISRRMERAIFYILAVENHPLSRSNLIDYLWPQAELADPRSALRTSLSRLRGKLPDSDLLVTDLDQVWLDPDRISVDVLEFESQYHKLQTLLSAYQETRPLPDGVVQQIKTALELWHGDDVIEGDNLANYSEIEAWRQTLSRRLGYHRQFLLKRLAQHLRTSGLLDEALEVFTQLAQANILDVSYHLEAINILADLGRHHDVIVYCDDLERVFETNYNSPLPDAILERCQLSRIRVDANSKPSHIDWPAPLTMHLRMVDRQAEVQQVHQAFFKSGLVVLTGRLGIGKTRLVQECYQTLEPRPKLFFAPCREMDYGLPLSPLIHSLRNDVPFEIWQQLESHWLERLCVLLPELSEFCVDFKPPQQANFPSGRQNLFDAIHQVLRLMAKEKGRILFLLDDAQWADRYSLLALSYLLGEGFFDRHGLLVLAFRSEEPNQDLEDLIARYQQTHPVTTVNLTGLDRSDLSSLIEQTIGNQPSQTFTSKLFEETKGNPFLSLEIIRELQNSPNGIEDFDSSSAFPLPATVQAIIVQRLSQFDDPSKTVLRAGAVLGSEFRLQALEKLSNVKQKEFIASVDGLVQKGFLIVTQHGRSNETVLQFPHEKVKEIILRETSSIQVQHLHKEAALLLSKAADANANAAVIAKHFRLGMEIRKAFKWLLNAAQYAWTLGARYEVLRNFEEAEELIQTASDDLFGQEETLRLYQNWIEFAYQSNQIAMLENLGVKLQYLGDRDSDPLVLGISQIALSNACFLRNDFETGFDFVQRALKNIPQTGHPHLFCQALYRKGALNWWLLNYKESIDSYEQVQEIIKQQPTSPKLEALAFSASYMAGTVYYALGDANKTLKIAKGLGQEHESLSPYDHIRQKNLLAMAFLLSADYKHCISAATNALEITNVLDNTFVEEVLLLTLSRAENALGYLDEAYRHAQKAIELAEKSHHIDAIINGNSILGDIFMRLQNYSRASQHYQLAKMRHGISRITQHGLENEVALAYSLAWSGSPNQAVVELEQPLKISRETGMQQTYVRSLMVSAVTDIVMQSFNAAEDKYQKAEGIINQNGLLEERFWCWIGQSRLMISRHQFTEAEHVLSRLIKESQKAGSVWTALYGVQFTTQILRAQGKQEKTGGIDEAFNDLMSTLEAHTRSDALRQSFQLAQKAWVEGHHYP